MQRPDNRRADELRPVHIEPGIAPNASASVLISVGDTRVICAANAEKRVPRWMRQQRIAGGWITAEYSMLPYSTLERKMRDSTRGTVEGRTIEIQRLIGRSMRAVAKLENLAGYTIWIDCDVLQADGGTRTAAITGAYVAARVAAKRLLMEEKIAEDPFQESVAAVSVGVHREREILDLNYAEDKDAEVDFNVVMSGAGRYVEVQGSGEAATFSHEQLEGLLSLARTGIRQLTRYQSEVVEQESVRLQA